MSLPVLPRHKAALDLHFCQGNWSIWLPVRCNIYSLRTSVSLPYHLSYSPYRAHFKVPCMLPSLHRCSLSLTKCLIFTWKCFTLVHESTCSPALTLHGISLQPLAYLCSVKKLHITEWINAKYWIEDYNKCCFTVKGLHVLQCNTMLLWAILLLKSKQCSHATVRNHNWPRRSFGVQLGLEEETKSRCKVKQDRRHDVT